MNYLVKPLSVHLGRRALPSRLHPQEGGDQHDGDQGHQNGSLIILFIYVTLLFDIIFDSQIDLGYYTGVVPFSPPPAAGAGQGITPTAPSLWHPWENSHHCFLIQLGADSLTGSCLCQEAGRRQVAPKPRPLGWEVGWGCYTNSNQLTALPTRLEGHFWVPGCCCHLKISDISQTFPKRLLHMDGKKGRRFLSPVVPSQALQVQIRSYLPFLQTPVASHILENKAQTLYIDLQLGDLLSHHYY